MAADEDGERWSALPLMNTSEDMTGTVRLDGVRMSDRHLSEDGTFDNMMQTDGSNFFVDNHGSHRRLSDDSPEHFGETTDTYLSGNTTERDLLDHAVGDHDHGNLNVAENRNHRMAHHSHANLSLGMMMMEHDHEEYDHAHGGRQLMMEIGILTSLVMLILALVILLVIPSNRCTTNIL